MVDGPSHPLGWAVAHRYRALGRAHGRFVPRIGGDVGRGWENIAVRWSETHLQSRGEEGVWDAVRDWPSHSLGSAVAHRFRPFCRSHVCLVPYGRRRGCMAVAQLWSCDIYTAHMVPNACEHGQRVEDDAQPPSQVGGMASPAQHPRLPPHHTTTDVFLTTSRRYSPTHGRHHHQYGVRNGREHGQRLDSDVQPPNQVGGMARQPQHHRPPPRDTPITAFATTSPTRPRLSLAL